MGRQGLFARALRLVLAFLLLLVVPTLLGVALDYRLKIWPWGLLTALMVGLLASSIFVVRYTFNAYRRVEEAHAADASKYAPNPSPPLVKEDERA